MEGMERRNGIPVEWGDGVEAGSKQELVRSIRDVSPEHMELIWAKKDINYDFCVKCLPDTLCVHSGDTSLQKEADSTWKLWKML